MTMAIEPTMPNGAPSVRFASLPQTEQSEFF